MPKFHQWNFLIIKGEFIRYAMVHDAMGEDGTFLILSHNVTARLLVSTYNIREKVRGKEATARRAGIHRARFRFAESLDLSVVHPSIHPWCRMRFSRSSPVDAARPSSFGGVVVVRRRCRGRQRSINDNQSGDGCLERAALTRRRRCMIGSWTIGCGYDHVPRMA